MAVKTIIGTSLEKDRCIVRMAPEDGFSKYGMDWLHGRGANWPEALRNLADKIDALRPTYKRGRRPHQVKAAARLRQSV